MDISTYYLHYYNFTTQVPTYETYQNTTDGQFGAYEGQLSLYEEQSNSHEVEENGIDTDPGSIPLPQELTNMFKPLECELCGVTVICPASAFTHYEGKTHIKNVNAYMKEHYNVLGSLKLKKERFMPIKCEVCNIELTSKIVYQQHFSGKQHLKNLKKKQYSVPLVPPDDIYTSGDESILKDLPPPPPPPKLSDFVCEICNISTNTEQQLRFHKNGQKHKRKLNKLKESHMDSELYAFYNEEWMEETENNGLEEDLPETPPFIENAEMDYPLQFNEGDTCNETNKSSNGELNELQKENGDNVAKKNTETVSKVIPSSLIEKTREISLDLKIENGKVLSSTGIFLRQLSAVCHQEENISSNNDKDSATLGNGEISPETLESNILMDKVVQEEASSTEVPSATQKSPSNNAENSGHVKPVEISQEGGSIRNQSNSTEEKSEAVCLNDKREMIDQLEGECSQKNSKLTIIDTEKVSDKHDPNLDKVLTKLAIEEIEKESHDFGKIRPSKKVIATEEEKNECNNSKYKYDKAGYRINEEVRRREDSDRESDNDSRRRSIKSRTYKNNWYPNKVYNNRWNNRGFDNWNSNNYRTYKYYDHRYKDSRNSDYRNYSNKDHDKQRKRKRDKHYSSEEEYRSRHKSRRSRKDDKKQKSGNYSKKHRNSSRSRKGRSHSSESSGSERSRSSSRRERYRNRTTKKGDLRSEGDGRSKRDRKHRSDHSTSRSSSSRSSSRSSVGDYRLDKDGMCDRHHRCEKAYKKCPYKHKEPYKPNPDTSMSTVKQEECDSSWNPEPPINFSTEVLAAQIKVEKEEPEENIPKHDSDPALSAYVISNGTYYCKFCIVSTKSNELFREHLQTPKHKLLVKYRNKI